MKASVVVLSYNASEHIRKCIEHLRRQEHEDYEVVVIENASTDDSLRLIDEASAGDPRLRVIRSEWNRGCAGGRNLGVAESRGEFVAFVDADAYAEPNWLPNVLRVFDDPRVGVAASLQILARNRFLLNGLGGTLNLQGYGWDLGFGMPVDVAEIPERAVFASGNGLTVRRAVFERVGPFDDDYVNYYEDVDFCLRARRAGFLLALARDAVLRHAVAASSGTNAHRSFLLERNRIRTVLKHYPPWLLLEWLAREARFELSASRWQPAGTFRRSWDWNFRGLGRILRFRRDAARRLGPFRAEEYEPYWGPGEYLIHNLFFKPDEEAWGPLTRIGEDEFPSLLYGWHAQETQADGRSFRWSDGVAAVGLRARQPAGEVRIGFYWPDPASAAAGARVWLLHLDADASWTGELPAGPPHVLHELVAPVEVPAGRAMLLFETRSPFVPEGAPRRSLGVGLTSAGLYSRGYEAPTSALWHQAR